MMKECRECQEDLANYSHRVFKRFCSEKCFVEWKQRNITGTMSNGMWCQDSKIMSIGIDPWWLKLLGMAEEYHRENL